MVDCFVRIDHVEPSLVSAASPSVAFAVGSFLPPLGQFEVLLDGHPAGATIVPLPPEIDVRERATTATPRERFAAIIPLEANLCLGTHSLGIRSRLGRREIQWDELADIEIVEPTTRPLLVAPSEPASEPLVAICLATYDPPAALLERQIESIRAQTHQRFVCIVSDDASSHGSAACIARIVGDDPRFICFRSAERLGYYRNFERALERVPRDARFVALADQDDYWYPEKLGALVETLDRGSATLVCSDMRIVDSNGQILAPSYWTDRQFRFDRLGSLVMTNTVTGASAMFRRELLDYVLPFPPNVGHPYHDHWVASVALSLGQIQYVDRPLYDYVQHGANVVGSHVHSDDFRGGLLSALRRFATAPRSRLASSLTHASTQYLQELLRVELFARTLELRLRGEVTAESRSDLHNLARLGTSTRSFAWLVGRSARDLSGSSETLGAENQLLKAIVWRRLHVLRRRVRVGRARCGTEPRRDRTGHTGQ
jgi:glycosyltransferase involved in cell wall biosynthesis